MPLRCVYTDLDGTLLGKRASLVRDGDGRFTLLAVRALEACFRADVEVVLMSGRRREMLAEDARLLGLSSYVYEIGGGVVIDGEDTPLAGAVAARDGQTVYDAIDELGAPRLLLERYAGRLEYHAPWHRGREVTHLLRGLVETDDADATLAAAGLGQLRLVDNGAISPKPTLADLPGPPHAYHLLPHDVSKARGVVAHMRARGFDPEDCIAVGDSREDAEVSEVVGRFFLVANALEKDPDLGSGARVEVTEAAHGAGFYEAVVRAIAEGRAAWQPQP